MSLFSSINSISLNSTKRLTKAKTQEKKFVNLKSPSTSVRALNAGKLVGTCMKALIEEVPSSFCYRSGVIPTACPEGYNRNPLMKETCTENCKPTYAIFLTMCYECDTKYKNNESECKKNIEDPRSGVVLRNSYFPKMILNFDPKIPCPLGMNKVRKLCFNSCENIQMQIWGLNSCAAEKETCSMIPKTVVVEDLKKLSKAISNISSSATANPAKTALKAAMNEIGQPALKAALNSLKLKFSDGKSKQTVFEKATKNAQKLLKNVKIASKNIVKNQNIDLSLMNICTSVWDYAI